MGRTRKQIGADTMQVDVSVSIERSKGPFVHAICGKEVRDAYNLQRQSTCRLCKAMKEGLPVACGQVNQPRQQASEDFVALREELERVKMELAQIKEALEMDSGEEEEEEDEEEDTDEDANSNSLERPDPKEIEMVGDGESLNGGTYVKFDKNVYALGSEVRRQTKEAGYVHDECKLLRMGFLCFGFDDEAHKWLLEAKRCRLEEAYARERPRRLWEVWSEEGWVSLRASVRAEY
jgi:hypothetical protein